VAVIAEVPIGFVVLQMIFILQLLLPADIGQEVGLRVMLPLGAPPTATVTLSEVVPATLLQ